MSEAVKRYLFSGHAIGAAARFHRLDKLENLDHVIPTLGTSVLPTTGGVSKSQVSNYCFQVDQPRKRSLLSVRRIETTAEGRDRGDKYVTEVEVDIDSLAVVEKLHIELIKVHLLSTRDAGNEEPSVSTKGNQIEGVRLGAVTAKITLDEEPLCAAGTKERLGEFYRNQPAKYRRKHSWRFNTPPEAAEITDDRGYCKYSLVREIKLYGPEKAKREITVDGYTIIWKGFGRIILGEVLVKGHERKLSMVRLAMGSDAGGDGSLGEGQTNGQVSS